MNVQLYNFHSAGVSVHSGSGGSLSELPNPSGADNPRSSASCGIGDAIQHNLCRVNLPIVTVFVQVLTVAQSAPVVLIEHLQTIANADLLDSTLCAFICLKNQALVDAPIVLLIVFAQSNCI